MAYYNEHTVLWLDGKLLKASEAKTDLYSQSLHYGYAVFEGIRSYKTAAGTTKIFKPVEHYVRLQQSAAAMNMPFNYSADDLIAATYEVLAKNAQDPKIMKAGIRNIVDWLRSLRAPGNRKRL